MKHRATLILAFILTTLFILPTATHAASLQQARQLVIEGKYTEAIAVFVKLIDLNGDHAAGYKWTIGGCYESMTEWKKAIGMYRQIDDFPKTHFAMADCHRKLNEHKVGCLPVMDGPNLVGIVTEGDFLALLAG